MQNISQVKSDILFPLVIECLSNGQKARITVTGNSMSPFLKEIRDSVELAGTQFDHIKRGDIVLIRRLTGAYVLHRVLRKKKDCFFMVGDAQQWIEGPLKPDQLIAKVTKVWRKGKEIECERLLWKIPALLWLRLRAYRGFMFRFYSFLKKIKLRLSRGVKAQ